MFALAILRCSHCSWGTCRWSDNGFRSAETNPSLKKAPTQEAKSEDMHDSVLVVSKEETSKALVLRWGRSHSAILSETKRKTTAWRKSYRRQLNRTVMVKEHFQCLLYLLKISGWLTRAHLAIWLIKENILPILNSWQKWSWVKQSCWSSRNWHYSKEYAV